MLIQLPNGLLDGVDLFNYADIDELRGKQQNYLADKDLVVGNIGHIPKLLEELVLSLQTKEGLKWQGKISEAVWKLPSGDLETLLIKIRENTYGPKYYHEAECTHCQHVNKNLRLDLDKLVLDVMPTAKMLDKEGRIVKLPKANVDVELKPIYLKDLFDVIKITSSKQDSLITSLVAISIKRLGDNDKVTPKDIDNISAKDIMFLQEKLDEMKLQGSIDTNIQMDCSNCKKEFEMKLNCFDPSFFVPTKGSLSLPS